MRLDNFLPYTIRRPFWFIRRVSRQLARRLRYGSMPSDGWGHGWRVLIFQFTDRPSEELHVLAPVVGDQLDWDMLRGHMQGEPWPDFRHEAGKLTGFLSWVGHHIYVVMESGEPQRVSMDKLIPGEFRGGVDRPFLLVAVRDACLTQTNVDGVHLT